MDKNSAYLRELTQYRERVIGQALLALHDDIGSGDITTLALSSGRGRVEEATIVAREEGILCGVFEAESILEAGGLTTQWNKNEGDSFRPGESLAAVRGNVGELLSRERIALNYLQILSGIATLCQSFSKRFPGKVASLRKTHPGIAFSEKRAVLVGGVLTHRLCLDDGFLIKDNHLALVARSLFGEAKITEEQKLQAIEESLRLAKKYRFEHLLEKAFIEVEVESIAQGVTVANVFKAEKVPDMVLLDNMKPNMVRKCVKAIHRVAGPSLLIEASGGITPSNLELYLDTGVDVASMSFLTLDARPLDIGMKIVGYK
ncbi:carboxylating nicotinate-nucleotide diphosphorylase [Candidatus Bathyarchaeota archaeon]|nr:carboxylating nicotinate-nucleotide diphosphorylase [Candidatus Bathyarchaeota archaeon]